MSFAEYLVDGPGLALMAFILAVNLAVGQWRLEKKVKKLEESEKELRSHTRIQDEINRHISRNE